MRVFLSFSGAGGRDVAAALRDLIRRVPECVAFAADADIQSGDEWSRLLSEQLSTCDVLIACLTPDSLGRPWMLFEAGAVAGRRAPVVPYLVHISANEVPGPLQGFQARQADESGTRLMLRERLAGAPLDEAFEAGWPALEAAIAQARNGRAVSERLGRVEGLVREGVTHVWRNRSAAKDSMLADIATATADVTMVARVYLSELVKDTASLGAALARAAAGTGASLRIRILCSDPTDGALMARQLDQEDPERRRWTDPEDYARNHVARVHRIFLDDAVAEAARRGAPAAAISVRRGRFQGWLTPFSMLAIDDRVLYVSTYASGASHRSYGTFGPCLRLEAGDRGGELLRAFQDDLAYVLGRAVWDGP